MCSSPPPHLTRAPITADLFQAIYEADQSIYPVFLPFSRLQSWAKRAPELSIAFCAAGEPAAVGTVVVLPVLGGSWQDLLAGRLRECDIQPEMLAERTQRGARVGLHIFHIERFARWKEVSPKRFADVAMVGVGEVAEGNEWRVLGYSALTATPPGRATFKRLGFIPTGYQELFLTSSQGEVLTQCVHSWADDSPLDLLGQAPSRSSAKTLSTSEMVVRHLENSCKIPREDGDEEKG